jgi:hypothetical protein
MAGLKRRMRVGMGGVVMSLAVLTGCTTGCDSGSTAQEAVQVVQAAALVRSSESL